MWLLILVRHRGLSTERYGVIRCVISTGCVRPIFCKPASRGHVKPEVRFHVPHTLAKPVRIAERHGVRKKIILIGQDRGVAARIRMQSHGSIYQFAERAGRGPLVLSCSEGRRGRHAGGAARWLGGPATAKGSAPKPAGGPICQASHKAPKLGGNIRPVTRHKVVGSLGPDGRLKFLSVIR